MRMGLFSTMMADAESRQRAPRVAGLRYAEVAEITDEGYVLEWLSGGVRSRSAPARVARLMAGNERGAYFPFERGDEVVVGFEDGNLDRPVILGGLWSDVDVPPTNVDTSDTNNTRSIVSRAKAELTFDDTQGATKVLVKSAGGLQVLLDDSAKAITLKAGGLELVLDDTGKKITLKVDESNKIEISASGVKVQGTRIDLN